MQLNLKHGKMVFEFGDNKLRDHWMDLVREVVYQNGLKEGELQKEIKLDRIPTMLELMKDVDDDNIQTAAQTPTFDESNAKDEKSLFDGSLPDVPDYLPVPDVSDNSPAGELPENVIVPEVMECSPVVAPERTLVHKDKVFVNPFTGRRLSPLSKARTSLKQNSAHARRVHFRVEIP